MLTLPGLIDPHVHLRDPGQTHKEDFTTGTAAALAGGFTTILDMPNNKIPITTEKLLFEKQEIAKDKILCDVGFYFGSIGDNLNEFEKVQKYVLGLKVYLNQTTGNYIVDEKTFRNICTAWPTNKPLLVHAEENILSGILDIAKQTYQRIHVCHVSSKNELKIIIKAKEKGQKVTCGVTPHHLFLNEKNITRLDALGNVKPPLKTKSDNDFLWQHIKDIDIIESDHAPHTLKEKEKGAFGMPGLETTLPLLLTAAHQEKITVSEIIRLCHDNPLQIFLNNNKTIKQFNNDTYIEIDENEEWTIQNKNLNTRSKWSPFNGRKVKGKVKKVVLRGTKVFEDGKILVKPGFGKVIP